MSLRVRGYHFPTVDAKIEAEIRRFGPVEIELLRPQPEHLRRGIAAIRSAAAACLRTRALDDVLLTIDRVVTNWLRPDYHLRRLAEEALPPVTGFSSEMIRHGLPLMLAPLRAEAIRALLADEIGDRRAAPDASSGSRIACGPRLIAHVLSGNIPGLAATPMLLSLALKSAVLIKSAGGDPLFAALFADSIREVNEQLGRCLLVTHWRGGDTAMEEPAFADADLLVASGSDTAIAAIAARARSRFIGYGHKISFAVIGRECLGDDHAARGLADRLAYDVALWDQQGCLSPQLCYVERGGAITPAGFAEHLGEALARWACELPPRRLSLEEKAAVLRFRQEAEWQPCNGAALLASADSTDWTVAVEPNAEFVASCLNRCIRLKVVDSLSELSDALRAHRWHLEAAGVAVATDRVGAVAELLAQCGVHRICPIGTMQVPPLSWRQGGRPRVGDWVEWTAVEREA